jgi:hypothetical protein
MILGKSAEETFHCIAQHFTLGTEKIGGNVSISHSRSYSLHLLEQKQSSKKQIVIINIIILLSFIDRYLNTPSFYSVDEFLVSKTDSFS